MAKRTEQLTAEDEFDFSKSLDGLIYSLGKRMFDLVWIKNHLTNEILYLESVRSDSNIVFLRNFVFETSLWASIAKDEAQKAELRLFTSSRAEATPVRLEHELIYDEEHFWIETVLTVIRKGGKLLQVGILADNTKVRKLEINFSEAQRKLSKLFEALPGMAYRALNDERNTMVLVSGFCLTLTGYTQNDFEFNREVSLLDLIYEEDLPYFIDKRKSALYENHLYRAEYRIKHISGKLIWISDYFTVARDSAGKVVAFEGYMHDVSEQKAAEIKILELNHALKRFENAVMSTTIVSVTDNKGIIKYANRNFAEISGYDVCELIGQTHNIINSGYHPRSFWAEMWKTVLAGKVWRGEVRNKRKDGTFYWVDSYIVPFFEEDGTFTQIMSIRNDITEKKLQEEKIRENENKLLAYFNSGMNAHVLLDMNLSIVFFNKQAEILVRNICENNIRIAENIIEFVPHRLRLDFIACCEKAASGQIAHSEIKTQTVSNEEIYLKTVFSPAYGTQNILTGIAVDIENVTEKKIAEIKIKQQNEILKEIAWLQSHKVRAPLANILGLLSLTELDENEREQYFKMIEEQALKLDEIIHEIVEKSNKIALDGKAKDAHKS